MLNFAGCRLEATTGNWQRLMLLNYTEPCSSSRADTHADGEYRASNSTPFTGCAVTINVNASESSELC